MFAVIPCGTDTRPAVVQKEGVHLTPEEGLSAFNNTLKMPYCFQGGFQEIPEDLLVLFFSGRMFSRYEVTRNSRNMR